jgi:glycosyltransferase involved in cell wall biosynthesis
MIWLASFPRSGNTYLRNILYELYGIASSEYHFEPNLVLDQDYASYPVVKTHLLPSDLKPHERTAKSIYIVRDGRDAVVSMAHHRKDIIAPGSDFQENLRAAIVAQGGSYFGGWSKNAEQWIKQADLVLYYEDLIAHPQACIERVRTLLELPAPDYSKIPTFEQLKQGKPVYGGGWENDINSDVVENYATKFFRRGKAGAWKDELTDELHDLFWSHHGETMERLGYTYSGERVSPHAELEHQLLYKVQGALPPPPKEKIKVLLEASKLLLWYNEGTKRYETELLKGLGLLAQNPQSRWEIDVYIGGSVYKMADALRYIKDSSEFEQDSKRSDVYGDKKNNLPGFLLVRGYHFILKILLGRKYSKYMEMVQFFKMYPYRLQYNFQMNRILAKLKIRRFFAPDLEQYDVIHMPLIQNYSWFKRCSRPVLVVTIHDLTHLYFPQYHTPENIACCNEAMDFLKSYPHAIAIAISENTRKDYLNETGISSDQVKLIYEAANRRQFKKVVYGNRLIEVAATYKLPSGKFFLSLSTIEPRKNLVNAIKAFVQFCETHPQEDVWFVIAGKNGWKNSDYFTLKERHHKRIVEIGVVNDVDLPVLYSMALGLVYVSFYEGFGLPPLEAMSCGTPVIYGNNSSMIEVVGDTGYKADPADISSIASCMESLWFNQEERKQKAAAALKQSFDFSWYKTVAGTLRVYEEAYQRHFRQPHE